MCAVTAYNYRDMLCGIEHSGYSAPAYVVLFGAIPFGAAIVVCGVLAVLFYRKAQKMNGR